MPEPISDYQWKMPVLGALHRRWRGFRRRWNSQERWARWLGLPLAPIDFETPGLILVQIDGLSQLRLETALDAGKMPFLAKLLSQEHYQLRGMYSGVPSTTPAVQGELFYGVKQVVPAFAFRETATGPQQAMNDAEMAQQVEAVLSGRGSGLLQGGSAATNIFTGGAREARFCASVLGWNTLTQHATRTAIGLFMLANSLSVVRAIGNGIIEAMAAVGTAACGIARGNPSYPELRMIPSRSIVGVMLRDLATSGACLDAARGFPLIQLNYLAYDEHAHCRGTDSKQALSSLRKLDRSIKRLWRAAARSNRRDYQVWIYSDHGQEDVVNYEDETGEPLEQAIRRVAGDVTSPSSPTSSGIAGQRARWLRGASKPSKKPADAESSTGTDSEPTDSKPTDSGLVVNVTAVGPLGFVYFSRLVPPDACLEMAARLVSEAAIPLVVTKDAAGIAWAFNQAGRFQLPADAEQVLGKSHPYGQLAGEDLASLVSHPHAGQMVISGYRHAGKLLTFVAEKGAHGGPGPMETGAFILAPRDALRSAGARTLRPADFRGLIQNVVTGESQSDATTRPGRRTQSLTVVTYNAHTCIGMDGRLSPRRVARVLQQCDADIIALQELDVLRRRTQTFDQAREIARWLGMECHFYPAMSWGDEQYGDALLSRYPLKLVRAATLPSAAPGRLEPRGAVWASVQVDGAEIQVINTHLGLGRRERSLQVEALLGKDWLGDPRCQQRTIVCGDFNSPPFTRAYKQVATRFCDVQTHNGASAAHGTWFGAWPILRLDHIFVSPDIQVTATRVINSQLARRASDHLPLVAELQINRDTN